MSDDSMATVHPLPQADQRPPAKRRKRKAPVLEFTGWTRLDGNPDRVLSGMRGELSSVVVLGQAPDGTTIMASSLADPARVLWLLEVARLSVLQPD
jgi:hypothetical protein